MMVVKHMHLVIIVCKSKAAELCFIALAESIKGDGRSGYVLTFVWILFSVHLLGRHRLSLSKNGRGVCRSRGLQECIHTP